MAPPSYSMTMATQSMTERRAQAAKEALLDAALEAFGDRGIGFTMQDIADRAGVTHRTVYRYFSSREDLFAALAARSEVGLTRALDVPDTMDGLREALTVLFSHFERNAAITHALALNTLITGDTTAGSAERNDRLARWIRASYPHVADSDVVAIAAVLRSTIGGVGWHVLTTVNRLSGAEAIIAGQHLIDAVLPLLERLEEEGKSSWTQS